MNLLFTEQSINEEIDIAINLRNYLIAVVKAYITITQSFY